MVWTGFPRACQSIYVVIGGAGLLVSVRFPGECFVVGLMQAHGTRQLDVNVCVYLCVVLSVNVKTSANEQ